MTGFIVSVFLFRTRVSSTEAFEGLELGEGKPSRPVLRGPGGRKVAWPLGNVRTMTQRQVCLPFVGQSKEFWDELVCLLSHSRPELGSGLILSSSV